METIQFKNTTECFGRHGFLKTKGVEIYDTPKEGQFNLNQVNIQPVRAKGKEVSDSLRLTIHKEDLPDFILGLIRNGLDEGQRAKLVEDILAADDAVAVSWSIQDVYQMRPDLDSSQAFEVLKKICDNHDAGVGINWEVIEQTASDLFGSEPE